MYKDAFTAGDLPIAQRASVGSRFKGEIAEPRIRAVLREPLTHFLLFGVLIFLVTHAIETNSKRYTIDVTPADVTRIVNSFKQQYGSEPTATQLHRMVDNYVREEIYLREALALGLDKNDEIVRRRMAQKYGFLQQDMAVPREPSAQQLQAYYAEHRADFTLPERRSFDQVYFSIDQRGDAAARSLAERALSGLSQGQAAGGDEFPGPPVVRNLSREEIDRLFGGDDFAPRVFEATRDRWIGPVRSGYGWHLVRVGEVTSAKPRTLDEARDDVRRSWIETDQRVRNGADYDALLRRYTISRADRP